MSRFISVNDKICKHLDKVNKLLREYRHFYHLPPTEKTQPVLRRMDDIIVEARKEVNIVFTEYVASYINGFNG